MDEVALFKKKKTRDDLPCIKGITDHIIFQKGWLLGQHGFTATVLAMKMGFALTTKEREWGLNRPAQWLQHVILPMA